MTADLKRAEDTRERLEADVRNVVAQWYDEAQWTHVPGNLHEIVILRWLDRQAAITEEETRFKWVTALAEEIAAWKSKAEKLQEQVDELKGALSDLCGILDEIFNMENYWIIREVLEQSEALGAVFRP